MLIDWFTVGAQALNFLILVWLMKRYLYLPIINAIDTREKRIAGQIANAKSQMATAKRDREEFEKKNTEFEEQRSAVLSKATDEANAQGVKLIAKAQGAADELSEKRREALKADAKLLDKALGLNIQKAVFGIARKTLGELADLSLEARLAEAFIKRLGELDKSAKVELRKALETAKSPCLVNSAFDLPEKERAAMVTALNDVCPTHPEVHFQTVRDVICGIELISNGQKVSWSIEDYIAALETSVDDLASGHSNPAQAAKVIAKPTGKKAHAAAAGAK